MQVKNSKQEGTGYKAERVINLRGNPNLLIESFGDIMI